MSLQSLRRMQMAKIDRKDLYPLKPILAEDAAAVIEEVNRWQEEGSPSFDFRIDI